MTHDLGFVEDLPLEADQVNDGDSVRATHAGDFGTPPDRRVEPDVVIYPESTADVSAVLAAANDHGVPVTPFAAGTGLEGNATPLAGGISLDMTRMDAILDLRPADFQMDVEPGVMGDAIRERAASEGLFFPPLPSSGDISTIGGMIATDASGMQTVKYGEVADWVLELEAVLADGRVITAGSKAVKTSSGYNLAPLLIGNEGTLAVITRATIRLAGRPAQIRGGRAVFETLDRAAGAVADAVQSGVDVAKIELMDQDAAAMANAYSGTDLPDRPMIFFEFHANHGIEREIEFFESIVEEYDATRFEVAADEEMETLWQARKDLAFAEQQWDPDLTPLHPGDVTVPIGSYPDIVQYAKRRGEEEDVVVPCFGHGGDGNVHYTTMVDPSDPEMVARGERIYRDIVHRAIELGGTATGEHGIGMGKREYLAREHGENAVDVMRSIKALLDPNGILNPGKIFPDDEATGEE